MCGKNYKHVTGLQVVCLKVNTHLIGDHIMSAPLAKVREALAYAKFTSSDVRNSLLDLLKAIEADTVELSYEPSSEVEIAVTSLQETMDEADEVPAGEQDDEEDGA
jgi:hypothetical protein